MSRARFRLAVLIVAGLEFAPVAWLLIQILPEVADWPRPYPIGVFWLIGVLGAPSFLALLLAALNRALALAAVLCVVYGVAFLFL